MNWKTLIKEVRFTSAAVIVIVSILALFGVNLNEAVLNEQIAQAVELLAALGILGGSGAAGYAAKANKE